MNLSKSIIHARDALLKKQKKDHWQFPLESDCTVTAEYILLQHYLGDPIEYRDQLKNYILSKQNLDDGSWPLYDGGEGDLSCTIKCYFALKVIGFSIKHQEVKAALAYILDNGGAEKANVFTKVLLALHQQMSWEAIPWTPIELILLPKWFPFNIHQIAYWARCTMIPLSVLATYEAKSDAVIVSLAELFTGHQWSTNLNVETDNFRSAIILKLEKFCRKFLAKKISRLYHKKALKKTSTWLGQRANGVDGLGAIFPPMAFLLMALPYLDLPLSLKEQIRRDTKKAIRNLIVSLPDNKAFVQPCISPVWDTAISMLALNESLELHPKVHINHLIDKSAAWLSSKQIAIKGDWNNPLKKEFNLPYNGWAFQQGNDYYPDVDDTAMVILALNSIGNKYTDNKYYNRIQMAKRWLGIMQSSNGGYGAFDVDNNHDWINDIPFADHNSMLDPPTEDVSGRVLAVMNRLDFADYYKDFDKKKLIKYLLGTQAGGLWWGRWGTNYFWGTWSVVMGLSKVLGNQEVHRALNITANRLSAIANDDGGYGESDLGYETDRLELAESNAFHTSLALLTLCDLYENNFNTSEVVYLAARKAIRWLVDNQQDDGTWITHGMNAPGFPRIYHLKYCGYATYFPLWALSRAEKVFT